MHLSRRRFLLTSSALASMAGLSLPFTNPTNPSRHSSTLIRNARLDEMTPESLKAIRRGFKWLKRAELRDGSYGTDINQLPANIGCTAMAGLAMMASGSTPLQGVKKVELQKILAFILKTVSKMPANNITKSAGSQLVYDLGQQAHSFIALLFLTQIAGEGHLPKETLEAVRKVTDVVVKSQYSDGSWGHDAWAPILGTVLGWTSLRAAHLAGFDVGSSPQKTAEFLINNMSKHMDGSDWMHGFYKNAAGIRVLYEMGRDDEPVVKKSFKNVVNLVTRNKTAFNQAGGEEYLAFHLITEAMLQKGGDDWLKWFPVVRDRIIDVQNQDGSWTGHHCITSRTFCTATACLVLAAPNRYLPMSQG